MTRWWFPASIVAATLALVATPPSAGAHGDAAGAGEDPYRPLARPLRLPTVPTAARCPRTPGGRNAPRVAITIGRGPVYPVLGLSAAPPHPDGVVSLRGRTRRVGWYVVKTLWSAGPRARGRLLIRGARVDRPGAVRFHRGAAPRADIRWPPGGAGSDGWRYLVSSTSIRGAGCYAFQVDAASFTRVLVFRVVS